MERSSSHRWSWSVGPRTALCLRAVAIASAVAGAIACALVARGRSAPAVLALMAVVYLLLATGKMRQRR